MTSINASPLLAINRRLSFPILALLAALAVGLLFVLPGGFAQAQGAEQSFTYAENGEGSVATFTASDPEGVTPIVWSMLTNDDGVQDLGVFTDSGADGDDDSDDDVLPPDVADSGRFEINQNGVLTFESSPDYEMPRGLAIADPDNTNTYRAVVQASDGGVGLWVNWFKVTVTVTDKEEPGTVAEWTVDADGDGTVQTPGMLLQFQPEAILAVGAPIDSDGGVTNVRWQWYRSSSRSEMGTAIEGADAAIYTVSDTSTSDDVGMFLRAVATYSDRRGPNKTASYVSENPVQAARDDNTAPVFALTTETRVVFENSTGNAGSPLRATDDDGDILTYSIVTGGGGSFGIDRATGQLTVDGLNFEMLSGANEDNSYVVTVTATDSHGIGTVDDVTVTITVTDVNEAPTFGAVDAGQTPPENTMGMASDHPENIAELDIAEYMATDPEGGEVTLSLMGDDSDIFELNDPDTVVAGTKILALKEEPDFEMPGDQNRDNVYEVTVRASDGVLYAERMVTVKVIDADEMGEVELSSQDAMIGIELTAQIIDSDGGAPDSARFIDQVWQWHRLAMADEEPNSTDTDDNNVIGGATSDTYTPVGADRGMYLKARATYTDRTRDENNIDTDNNAGDDFVGFMNTATSDATTRVRNNPDNQAPVFTDGATTVRLVEENTEAVPGDTDNDGVDDEDVLDDEQDNPDDNVGGTPVIATDADGDTLNYTLTGRDADMFRLRVNGQIEVSDKADLDYEASRTHSVTITANDGLGESNSATSITVTVHVTDLDEKPMISDRADAAAMGEQTVEFAEDGTGPVIRLMASDPEDVTPIVWSLLQDGMNVQDLGIVQAPVDNPNDVEEVDIADRALFKINQNGELTFADSPNFEADSATGDDSYQVVVQASDGGVVSHVNWFKVTVNVTDVEESGMLAEWTIDPDGPVVNGEGTELGGQSLLQFNASAVLTVVNPTDDDGGVANVQWQWYRSRTASMTGGTAIDNANSGTYIVLDSPANPNDVGNYLRVEATYTDRRVGSTKTASYVALNPVQASREAENTEPEFSAPSVARRITEAMSSVGAPVRATDADRGDILTYSIVGDDADNEKFDIDRATGQLTVGGLDFENPTGVGDTDDANNYVVTVTATDSSGGSGVVVVTVTVTDVNEAPTFGEVAANVTSPVNILGMAADHQEEGVAVTESLVISGYTATDPEGGDVTLSLMGNDAALFELADDTDETAGVNQVLSFKEKTDFEMPGNRDNVYEVTVRASAGSLYADRMVTVKVTDADEEGEVKLSTQNAVVGIELMATLTDSDGGAPDSARFIDQVWTWHRLAAAAELPNLAETDDNNVIEGATSNTYTPVADDWGMYLKARVTYTDRTRDEDNDGTDNNAATFVGFMNTVTSVATTAVLDNPANQAPVFAQGATTVRLVEENTEALTGAGVDDDEIADNPDDNVGGLPVGATDGDEGDTLIHTLGGPDMDMFRLRDNGQIEVNGKADLNYEDSASHTVTVTATDSSGAANNSATITVTIHVTDLDERPVITEAGLSISGQSSISYEEGDTGDVATYTAVGPDAAGANLTLDGVDAGDFTLRGGVLRFRNSPDYENRADMDMDNEYEVTVKASDGTYTAMLDVVVAVINVDELGTVAGDATAAYAENGMDAVATYTADGPVTATWMLSGVDMDDFSIGADGMLMFAASPDFEAPADADMDNGYMVTVMAAGGGEMETVAVTVTVTNLDEDGTVSLSSTRPVVGTAITASLSDPDIEDTTSATWQWASSGAMDGTYNNIDGATNASYTPTMGDEGMYLQATASYDDGVGEADTEMAASDNMVVSITSPEFADDAATTLEVAENTAAGEKIGDPFTAMDADGDTPVYSLTGTDAASFVIHEGTGQLMTMAALDHEDKDTYMVTVEVRDNEDAMGNTDSVVDDSINVTINVTNMDEDGTVTLDSDQPVAGAAITASVSDPDGTVTVMWQWASSDAMDGTYTNIDGATSAAYTPTMDDEGMYLQATASYDDGVGEADTAMAAATNAVVAADTAPEFQDADGNAITTDTRMVAENSAAGTNVGDPVAATDADAGDTLAYSLGGLDAASFAIDDNGQITVGAGTMLDAEGTQATYMVTVTASDGVANDSIDVTITVGNTPLDGMGDTFDTNNDEVIQKTEAIAAVRAYFADDSTLTKAEVIGVIALYFESQS